MSRMQISGVSTYSATVSMPMPCASWVTARTSECERSLCSDVADERAVDLQYENCRRLQMRERREAGAEVIECETAAQLAEPRHQALRVLEIAHRGGLGQLECQPVARHAAAVDLHRPPSRGTSGR